MSEAKVKEVLTIKNFAGIREAEIELGKINIFIGPHASGKSVTLKLIYFFKNYMNELQTYIVTQARDGELSFDLFEKVIRESFVEKFPPNTWPKEKFYLKYSFDDFEIGIEGSVSAHSYILEFNYTSNILKLIQLLIDSAEELVDSYEDSEFPVLFDKQIEGNFNSTLQRNTGISQFKYKPFYIPAQRNFFSVVNLGAFQFAGRESKFDPFLRRFDDLFNRYKDPQSIYKPEKGILWWEHFDTMYDEFLTGTKVKWNGTEHIITHSDSREVRLSEASSGQQSSIPLLVVLRGISRLSHTSTRNAICLFVEEPEAHLFPIEQTRMINLLAAYSRIRGDQSLFISTHSPYVLTCFNNLLLAGSIAKSDHENSEKVDKIVQRNLWMFFQDVKAYSYSDGVIESIMDEKSGFIGDSNLDGASDELSIQFEKLLDLEYGAKA